ncbi:MAG: DUF5103 domain-containing protein [Odoribacter sp.]|nr:DUF5103 domain-containing protein [Odoribacter sp.]
MIRGIIVTVICAVAGAASARDTMDCIFNDRVKTVRVALSGDDYFAPPVVTLGSGDFLNISFDHLSEDREFLRFRAVRCDANWQPSSIPESQWLDGFNESVIDNYEFSRATTVHYVHYDFNFPNDDISPALSGNYLIEVYPEDDPSQVWFARRVMISEQSAPVVASVSSQTDVDYNKAHQQLSVAVDTERASVSDPFNDLTVMISQNGRADNEVALRQPLRISGRTAVYEHRDPLIFEAGNEYRRIEIVDVNYPGMGVEEIAYAYPYYHFRLSTDLPRISQPYIYDSTQHGRFFVREYNSDNSDVEADYAVVHFSLETEEMPGTMIFIDGDFTSRRFDDNSIMGYNDATGRYEKVLLLKQGAYNYQYLAVPPGARRGYTSVIEGDKYPTSNEYLIKVYTRGPLDRTDRLIGVTLINSLP